MFDRNPSTRIDYRTVLDDLDLLALVAEFTPMVIGTPPLELDLPTSDIDIACSASNLNDFEIAVRKHFGNLPGFQVRKTEVRERSAVIASFFSHDWELELFCQMLPVERQFGFQHFMIEQRLLAIDARLRAIVLSLRQQGLKTEHAFAAALALPGDPYDALLALSPLSDEALKKMIVN